MKNYFYEVWKNFSSHMLFLYLGVYLIIQCDLWFFPNTSRGIEPSTFTAFASTTSLLIVIYGLAKVNEWLRIKKSETAFDKTAEFIENLYKSFRLTKALHKNMNGYNIDKIINADAGIADMFIEIAETNRIESKKAINECATIKDSLHVWSVKFLQNTNFDNLIDKHHKFTVKCHMLTVLSKRDMSIQDNIVRFKQVQVEMDQLYTQFKSSQDSFSEIPYEEMFNIEKK